MTNLHTAPGATTGANIPAEEDVAPALEAARELLAAGIPIFTAAPAMGPDGWDPTGGTGGTGYHLPRGWEQTKIGAGALDRWRPGHGLLAVTGRGVDLLDIDPRAGGSRSFDELRAGGAVPMIYATADTPSGGQHHLISSLDIASRDGVMPGIDVKAGEPSGRGRGCMFLAPTTRLSKLTGELGSYRWTSAPDGSRIATEADNDDTGVMLRDLVNATRSTNGNSRSGTRRFSLDESSFVTVDGDLWSDVDGLLRRGRQQGVMRLASSLRGRGGFTYGDAIMLMRAIVWPRIDQTQAGHPFEWAELEAVVRDVFGRYPDGAEQRQREQDPGPPAGTDTVNGGHVPRFDASHPLWDTRHSLQAIRGHARAGGTNPFAVLPVVLARVLGHVPPSVVLPPLGYADRGHAALNTFTALVAWSGGGKGLVNAAAAGAVAIPDSVGGRQVFSAPLGSGEGLVEWFARRGDVKEGEDPVVFLPNAPILDAPEVDHFGALVAREGSTFASVLRTAWSSELLGTSNRATSGNRLTVPAHTYRLALVLGVQPLRARRLLADAAGGTPQRFLWASSEDPTLPDSPVRPPAAVKWNLPETLPGVDQAGLRPLALDDSVAGELWAAHIARRRGQVRDDAGHENLVRLKVAAGLAILERRFTVTAEDWELAGVIAACSTSTLAGIRATLDNDARRSNRARADLDAERAVTVAERVASAEVERTCRYVLRQLGKSEGGMTRRLLSQAAGKRYRPHLVDALDVLTEGRHIELKTVPGQGQESIVYTLRGQGEDVLSTGRGGTCPPPMSHPSENAESSGFKGVDGRGGTRPTPGRLDTRTTPVSDDELRAS